MPNNDYWKERMESIENMSHKKGRAYTGHVDKLFRNAERIIQKKIEYWYAKIAMNNEVSLSAAKEMLRADELEDFHLTVEEYIKKGESLNYDNRWMKQLENASAKVHIRRLEALQLQMQQECEVLFGNLTDGLDKTLTDIYTESYYHTAYEFMRGNNVGWAFNKLDTRKIAQAINTAWAYDEKTFKARCWNNKQKLINELNTTLTQSIIRGESPQRAIDQLSKRMQVSRYGAGRLIMTESCAVSTMAQKGCYKELGVERFEFVATLDSSTSDVCRSLDGKVFDMADYKIGVNVPPLHCFCRSCTAPYYEDDFGSVGERAARGDNGKTYYVSADVKYEDWKKSFIDGDKPRLKEFNASAALDDESDYIVSKKYYDEQVEHLNKLEKESDDLLDAYMTVMDTPDADYANKLFEQKFEEVESFKQILKDLKAQLTGKEAKAVRQVEKNLAVKSGIPISQVKMTGMPYDSAKTVYDSYETVLNLYPELKGNLSGFMYTKDFTKGAYAACTTLTGDIKAYGHFSDFEKMIQVYADDVAEGFHPIGTDYRSIIVHELGHALDGYMTKNKLLGADFNQYGILSYSSSAAKDMVLSHLGFDRQEIVTELKNQGLTFAQRRDILKQKEKDFIKQHISEYAAENGKEFFAECFAEYVMSDSPRKAASFLGEIINTSLGR